MSGIVIRNALLPEPSRTGSWDVFVEGELISAIQPAGTWDATADVLVLDAQGGWLLPGLVNAHTHSPENLARGLAARSILSDWLPAIWHHLDRLSPREIRQAVLLGAMEMIRTGVTGVVDHFRQTPMREDALEAVIDAYAETGLDAVVSVMLRDPVGAEGLIGASHVAAVPPAAEQLRLVEAFLDYGARKGVSLGLGPSAPHRCSDGLLEQVAALAAAKGLPVQTHVNETAADAAAARERFGMSAIAHLHRLGLLGRRISLAHCVWLEPQDADILAGTGSIVVHNPVANLRLGSGTCDLPRLLSSGTVIALGTDGAASNDGQNIWESLKLTALLPRRPETSPQSWPSCDDVLAMAIDGGRAAMAQETARLQPGQKASLAVFDKDPFAPPTASPAGLLVLGTTARRARHVLSRGRVLLSDYRLLTIDEAALHEEVRPKPSMEVAS
ncbi:amidohydrolase family protein [Telmatospirillum sp. J64-1]|uniref:amidohydrolase family protein n=1 Tax=Telmatospirillum sp. J64-1 TaxID=2502183 RepID=UPI00115C7408|nr:amidohydrolase family protein [Telmatospirillum sp. J64-1]